MALKKEEVIANHRKADIRIKIDLSLLAIAFTLFTFIYAIKPQLLKENYLVTMQLVLAIPLLVSSALAKSKMSYSKNGHVWGAFSFIAFLVAYSFLINIIGLLLTSAVSSFASLIYFAANIFLALGYSFVSVRYDQSTVKKRFTKDLLFVGILIILGILPSLGLY